MDESRDKSEYLMYEARRKLYQQLEQERDSKVVAYVTGDRKNLEAAIAHDAVDLFVDHLDLIGPTSRITLYLYTRGGDTLAAWSLANLLRTFCDRLEIVVPARAHSAGTLISLSAETVVMTKQAALGPIDPSVTGPLNPPIPNAQPNNVVPVSVEAINGFVEFAQTALGDSDGLKEVLLKLADSVHPMVLGQAYRTRRQIRMLGERLLRHHMAVDQPDDSAIERILDFLCSDSGSHDYTINRREAADLGLPMEIPSPELYELIKAVFDDFVAELDLRQPYNPAMELGDQKRATYSLPRALIESVAGGSHVFVSEGTLTQHQVQGQAGVIQLAVADQRSFEGWRKRNG